MRKICFFLLIMSLCINLFANNNYESKTLDRDENKIIEFNKFYLAHYFVFDILLALNIYDQISLEEKKNIINDLYIHLKNSYQKEFTFTSIKPINFVIFIKPFKIQNDMSILMITNYDTKTNKIIPYKSSIDTVYAKQYFVFEKMLMPRKMFFDRDKSKSEIKKFLNDKNYNAAADFVLYDDNLQNDSNVIDYVNEGLKNNISLIDKAYLNLTLMEYYLLIKNYEKYDEIYKIISNDIKEFKIKKEQVLVIQELQIMNDLKFILQ